MSLATNGISSTEVDVWKEVEAHHVDPEIQKIFEDLLQEANNSLPSVDEEMLRKAFRLAAWAHRNDKRASGLTYITHPLAVAKIMVADLQFDDICVAAALLHDVVEDNNQVSLLLIDEKFGSPLTPIIDGLTKIEREFESRHMKQAENFKKLLLSMASDVRVILVKFADRLHNMRTISSLSMDRQIKIASETRNLFAPLSHRFGLFNIKNEFEDLSLKVLDSQGFYEITEGLQAKKSEREAYVKRFIEPLREYLEEEGFKFEIYGRPKHIYSIYRKMRKQDLSLDEIYDLFAIRIILGKSGKKGKADCWRVYSLITDLYKPITERFRDFVSVPKSNGYQSLHTTVLGPDGKRIEVQIRTKHMHEVAEKGVAAHWKYKEGRDSGEGELEDERYAWVRELLEHAEGAEEASEFITDFRHDFQTEEIYVFTPKGDLWTFPKGSTPVDFAFRIHTEIGMHCNGAIVNGKAVPLSHKLNNGEQISILTNKNKRPNPSWMSFVVTQKAKSKIRQWLNEERREFIKIGKDSWEKVAQKNKIALTATELSAIARELKFSNAQQMFAELGQGFFNVRDLLKTAKKKQSQGEKVQHVPREEQQNIEKFLETAQANESSSLLVNGEVINDLVIDFAPCCKPIPGDPVYGYLARKGGIKIHRKSCINTDHLMRRSDRILNIEWARRKDKSFISGLKVVGEDRVGVANEITNAISKSLNINIRSLTVQAQDAVFEATIVLDVKDLDHLKIVIDRLKKIEGMYSVSRLEE